jgi:hypothetical protein
MYIYEPINWTTCHFANNCYFRYLHIADSRPTVDLPNELVMLILGANFMYGILTMCMGT